MVWERIGVYVWEGLVAAIIAVGTALSVLQAWPTKVQWLTLVAGGAVSFAKAVQAYRKEPK